MRGHGRWDAGRWPRLCYKSQDGESATVSAAWSRGEVSEASPGAGGVG
jgi:hypothetical protein